MSVLSGYGKFKRYVLTDSGYQLCSQWTSSNTVHFDDGNTAQTKVGAINGITDSLTATNSNIALSAKAGKSLQDQVTSLNTGLGNKAATNHTHDERYYTETEVNNLLSGKANSSHSHSSYAASSHNHDERYYTENEIDNKIAIFIETVSENNKNIGTGGTLLLSKEVSKTGWYIVIGNVRPKNSVDGSFNLFVNNTASPVYTENWSYTNGTPRIVSCNHVQAVGFFHASKGSYMILGIHSTIAQLLEGARLQIMCIRPD